MSAPWAALRRWARQSLLRRLWLWTTLIVVAVGATTTAASYLLGYLAANALQDAQLREIASLAAAPARLPDGVLRTAPGVDGDARVVAQRLGSRGGLPLPADLAPGMHVLRAAGHRWRVFVRAVPGGAIAAAQRTDLRSDAAMDSAQRTLFPLLSLIPLLALLAAWVVRRALRPVLQLARGVDSGDEPRLEALPVDQVPQELRPFVTSINGLLARVAALLERERRFVADAAHELRTPIAALTLQAENLAHLDLPPPARERLRGLQEGLARTRSVVEQLLSLARAQANPAPTLQQVEPARVLRDVLEDLLPLAGARRIDLGIERDEALPLQADRTQLYTLLRNAVDNALRYTPVGGRVDLGSWTSLEPDGSQWSHIDIEDSGPGIPPDLLAYACEPFNRLQREGEQEGSGLGLAIMSSIARNLGGRLLLDNRAGGGLRVRYSQRCAAPVGEAPRQPQAKRV